MKIGVDASCWVNGRGYGRFTRELLPRMVEASPGDTFSFFIDEAHTDRFRIEAANVEVIGVALGTSPTEAASADSSRSPGDMLKMTRAVKRARPDVLFFPSVYSYFPAPLGMRTVVTIHDAIVERFPELTIPDRKARFFWNAKVRLALWQSRIVLTVSEHAADDLERVLGVKRSRLRVAVEAASESMRPCGADEIAAALSPLGLSLGEPYIVYLGGFNPHKNVDKLAAAHARLAPSRTPKPRLVLVGTRTEDVFHREQDALEQAIAAGGSEDLVTWTGWLDDDALRGVLAGARCLAIPSTCEGFGLPAVEAASCGTPVVATTESPLPGLLEGGGFFVEPSDTAALDAALATMLDDDAARDAFAAKALERAQALTWAATTRATLAAIKEAAA